MTIGIFGGSFNPIHNGHLQIAQNLLELKIVDQIWLLPCYSHVWNKELASAEDRVKMIELALSASSGAANRAKRDLTPPRRHDGIKICKLEISQKKPMYAIDTVKILLKKYPQHNFFWIIGSDNFKTLHKWKSYEELLDLIPFLIVPRISNYSSTKIRARLQKGLSIKNLVPSPVEQYILDNKLYN